MRRLNAFILAGLAPALACAPGPTISLGSSPDGGGAASVDAAAVLADAALSAPDASAAAPDGSTAAPDAALSTCDVEVTPAMLDFCAIPGTAARLTVTALNHGSADCGLVGAVLAGSQAFSTSAATPAVIPAGGALDVEVTYAGAGALGDSGTLTLTFDAGTTVVVPLAGQIASGPTGCGARAPDASVPPDAGARRPDASVPSPDAGALGPDVGAGGCLADITPLTLDLCGSFGAASNGAVAISNVGGAACALSSATIMGSTDLSLTPVALPRTIAPGAMVTVTVVYVPSDVVDDTASLALEVDGARTAVAVTGHLGGPLGCP